MSPGRILPAAALGAAALGAWPLARAQAPPAPLGTEAPREQVVITATKNRDAILTAKVEKALDDDPYLYVGHINVTTENGIVRLEGIARDPSELNRALWLARRAAGRRRVVDEIELIEPTEDNDF
jgi:BON domain